MMTLDRHYSSRSCRVILALLLVGGCAGAPSVSGRRLIAHQAMLDFSGLAPLHLEPALQVYVSLPASWARLPAQRSERLAHQQWRSPSHDTGVGIAYLKLPFPVTPKFLIWVAKMRYAQMTTRDGKPVGKLLAEWTDSEGREWFDAESDRFRVQGYAVTAGFNAWVVYTGCKTRDGCNWPELALAARSVQTVLPAPLIREAPKTGQAG